jgi:hypothetical protein
MLTIGIGGGYAEIATECAKIVIIIILAHKGYIMVMAKMDKRQKRR